MEPSEGDLFASGAAGPSGAAPQKHVGWEAEGAPEEATRRSAQLWSEVRESIDHAPPAPGSRIADVLMRLRRNCKTTTSCTASRGVVNFDQFRMREGGALQADATALPS